MQKKKTKIGLSEFSMIYVKPFFYVFGGLDSDPVANIGSVKKKNFILVLLDG